MSWEINPMRSHWPCHRWRYYIGFLKVNLICFSEALVTCRSQFSHQLLPRHHQPLHYWYLKWPTHISLLFWLLQYYSQWYCQCPFPPEECVKIFSGNHLKSSGQSHGCGRQRVPSSTEEAVPWKMITCGRHWDSQGKNWYLKAKEITDFRSGDCSLE